MGNDVKILYKYLMQANMHYRKGWYEEYRYITDQIERLRNNLKKNPELSLEDQDAYTNTEFKDKADLLSSLFANTGNGVASNGQSIFSGENMTTVKDDDDFLNTLQQLIQEPSANNHQKFAQIWEQKLKKNNPVHTNRATAACNLDLSTTVDGDKFNQLFKWLQQHQYISYEGNVGWYERNIFLTDFMRQALKDPGEDDFPEVDYHWINIFIWLIYENLSNPFALKKQVVKYGAPGTGKTFLAKQAASLQFEVWQNTYGYKTDLSFEEHCCFIQFHPSYTYEDFIEGLRPVPEGDGQVNLKLQNGLFKNHCMKAAKWEVDLYNWNMEKAVEEITVGDIPEDKRNGHWSFLQNVPDPQTKVLSVLPPYFALIDEINRAELSRVFGELMYCLEYRGVRGAVNTQYTMLNNDNTAMLSTPGGYKFFIPNNLYILASMNTIDRSVDSFDFALRRRFRWEEVPPDTELLEYHLSVNYPQWKNLAKSLSKLNEAIADEAILGKDFCIGHAYLWNLNYPEDTSLKGVKKLIWKDSLCPLLEEYIRGSGKENLVQEFGDNYWHK